MIYTNSVNVLMAHSIFFLVVGSLLLAYLGNDKTVLHFRWAKFRPSSMRNPHGPQLLTNHARTCRAAAWQSRLIRGCIAGMKTILQVLTGKASTGLPLTVAANGRTAGPAGASTGRC